jgi:hypothetical protein
MYLKDLHVETHHDDKRLIVRTITPPYRGAGAVTIVEDETGHADKLAIYNYSDAFIIASIPEGSVVVIKEPYYRYSGEGDYMICVDHPSDIILLEPDDPQIPAALRSTEPRQPDKTASEWRSAGDQAFLSKNLALAAVW